MKNKLIVLAVLAFAGLCLLALNMLKPDVVSSPGISSESAEVVLRERALARWAAIMEGDYETAYTFETPTYRAINDLVTYKARFAGQVARNNVDVVKINFPEDQPEIAKVTIKLDFATLVFGQVLESESYDEETWSKLDGQWWYLPPN